MSQPIIARTGLFTCLLMLAICITFLGYRAYVAAEPVVQIGRLAPEFTLPDTSGHRVSLAAFRGKAVVIFFGSDECPVSRQYQERLAELAKKYGTDSRVEFLAINSNTRARAASPADLRLIESGRVPTLLDPMAEVARSFGASVTPTFCVVDAGGKLRYSGAFDDGSKSISIKDQYCTLALMRVLEGMPVDVACTRTFGQAITWVK